MTDTPPTLLHPFARPAAGAGHYVNIVRGEGAIVVDDRGRRLVDGLASLWYCNVGHGRREIIDAVAAQMATLENYNTFDIFTNEPADRLAEAIAGVELELKPDDLAAIEAAVPAGAVAGDRYDEHQMTALDSEH